MVESNTNRRRLFNILSQIEKSIIVSNNSLLKDISLGAGSSGDMLFLYHYGNIAKNKNALTKAEALTKEIFINHDVESLYLDPNSYYHGIKGLVAAFAHIDKHFIELDFFKVFKNIDEFTRVRILYQNQELSTNLDKGIIGTGLYVLSRESFFDKKIASYNDHDIKVYDMLIGIVDRISLLLKTELQNQDFLSQVLLFINKVQTLSVYPEITLQIRNKVITAIDMLLEHGGKVVKGPHASYLNLMYAQWATCLDSHLKLVKYMQIEEALESIGIENYLVLSDNDFIFKSLQIIKLYRYQKSEVLRKCINYIETEVSLNFENKTCKLTVKEGIFGKSGIGLVICSILSEKDCSWAQLINL